MNDSAHFHRRPSNKTNPIPRYTIEGELVTTYDIAARIGMSRAYAADRLRKAQQLPGAVTWLKLGVTNG